MGSKSLIETDMVSVLIPAYNAEHCIRRCVDSVLQQTYTNLEVIILNDGSKDTTLMICEEYAKQDGRISVYSQENKGVAAARNTLLSHVSGEYILFVDADDWLELNAVMTMLETFQNHPDIDIAFCKHTTGAVVSHPEAGEIAFWSTEEQLVKFLKHQEMTGMLWNKMIRSNLFSGLTFDENVGYGEDAQMLWKVLQHSRRMAVLPNVLYHHVMDENSISHHCFSHNKYTAIYVWEEIDRDIEVNYPAWKVLTKERLFVTSTFSHYEMRLSNYRNSDENKHLIDIIRKTYLTGLKSRSVSPKMKAYATIAALGL